MVRNDALDSLYQLIAELDRRCGGFRRLEDCDGRMGWPRRGVYFFFEDGELRDDGLTSRITRIGTHGLRPSKSTLWGRLSAHRGPRTGRYAGGGNHRGSVFRLHVGSALLRTGDWSASIHSTWAVGGSAPEQVRLSEQPLEQAVSDRIGQMPFLWAEVDDPPGHDSERGVIERGAIALLSNLSKQPIDAPSPTWLGRSAVNPMIRQSGLWNVDHVRDEADLGFIGVLSQRIHAM